MHSPPKANLGVSVFALPSVWITVPHRGHLSILARLKYLPPERSSLGTLGNKLFPFPIVVSS